MSVSRITSLGIAAVIATVLGLAGLYGFFGVLGSYKNTDPGNVCVVTQGGWFDGKSVIEIRQPGEGRKLIGAYNKQTCFPTTERDTSGILDPSQTEFPTKDGVQVIVDGIGLWSLTSDPDSIKKFYNGYGRRPWNGKDINSPEGMVEFYKTRWAPVIADATREVIGRYNCIDLNNLCQYIKSPDEAVAGTAEIKAENSQNLSKASDAIAKEIVARAKVAFKGSEYFENIRYQNLRIRFQDGVNAQIQAAQGKRAETATAKLEAERSKQEAIGRASVAVETARGAREAAYQKAKAYALNPNQRIIDQIEAFCGPEGCDPQVIGGDLGSVISGLVKR